MGQLTPTVPSAGQTDTTAFSPFMNPGGGGSVFNIASLGNVAANQLITFENPRSEQYVVTGINLVVSDLGGFTVGGGVFGSNSTLQGSVISMQDKSPPSVPAATWSSIQQLDSNEEIFAVADDVTIRQLTGNEQLLQARWNFAKNGESKGFVLEGDDGTGNGGRVSFSINAGSNFLVMMTYFTIKIDGYYIGKVQP